MAFIVREPSRNKMMGRFRRAFCVTFKQFCEISSVHGIKYFHDPESSRLAKLLWILIVLAMFFCAVAMVWIFYLEFASNPIRINIDNEHTPLTNLAFPAVTVCPPTMYNYPDVKKIVQNLVLPDNTTLYEAIENINQIYAVAGKVQTYDKARLKSLQRIIEVNNMTAHEFIKLIRWKCSDLMFRCRFQSIIVNCSKTFEPSKTSYGYCCSFNVNEIGLKFQKYSALKFGLDGGLSIILRNNKVNQVSQVNATISAEHELFVHQNHDYIHRTMTSNSIATNREVFAVVRPTETECSDEFKALTVKNRQCILPDEHNMRFFGHYTRDNCEFECRVLSTFEACGCVPYFIGTNENTCEFTKLECIYKTFLYFQIADREKVIDETSLCYCPSSCQFIDYDVQVTQAKLQTAIESYDSFYNGIMENFTIVHVFMNSQVYRRLRRDTLSDVVILIGNLGSSFSLFIGMSMISLLEIVYFFTLVLWKNYSRRE